MHGIQPARGAIASPKNRMDGLYDEPRPGAPREIGDDEIAATIRKTLETRPKGATHWSLRTMAKEIGHAPSTVHRIWRAFGLQPHRVETFKLSSDPLFVEKVRDIVGLYCRRRSARSCCASTRRAQVQALDRTQPLLPMRPGQVERRTHDYKRHGTTSLFAALDVKAGTVVGKCMSRHRAHGVPQVPRRGRTQRARRPRYPCRHGQLRHAQDQADPQLVRQAPALARALHADSGLMDQSGRTLLRAADRARLKRGVFRSVADLEKTIKAYIDATNADPKPFPSAAARAARYTALAQDRFKRFWERLGCPHEISYVVFWILRCPRSLQL